MWDCQDGESGVPALRVHTACVCGRVKDRFTDTAKHIEGSSDVEMYRKVQKSTWRTWQRVVWTATVRTGHEEGVGV